MSAQHAIDSPSKPSEPSEPRPRHRFVAQARSLDGLVGAHPDSLHDLYLDGQPADPDQLTGQPEGKLLAVEGLRSVHQLARPLIVALTRRWMPWRGPSFAERGERGHHRVLAWSVLPFRCEPGPSEVDGRPTLFLRHDVPGNPWPINRTVDELRLVGEGIAIGPASLRTVRGPVRLCWWGITL